MKRGSDFWERVRRTDTCWLWQQGEGDCLTYGSLRRDGRHVRAHRMAYELTYGPIPDGLSVLHRCDNPPCCRPDHLFLGDQQQNMQDAASKRRLGSDVHPERIRRGEQINTTKLTANSVRQIRASFATGHVTKSALARRYGVHHSTIGDIISGAHWRHVEVPAR